MGVWGAGTIFKLISPWIWRGYKWTLLDLLLETSKVNPHITHKSLPGSLNSRLTPAWRSMSQSNLPRRGDKLYETSSIPFPFPETLSRASYRCVSTGSFGCHGHGVTAPHRSSKGEMHGRQPTRAERLKAEPNTPVAQPVGRLPGPTPEDESVQVENDNRSFFPA